MVSNSEAGAGCLLVAGVVLLNFAFWGFIVWLAVNFVIPALKA